MRWDALLSYVVIELVGEAEEVVVGVLDGFEEMDDLLHVGDAGLRLEFVEHLLVLVHLVDDVLHIVGVLLEHDGVLLGWRALGVVLLLDVGVLVSDGELLRLGLLAGVVLLGDEAVAFLGECLISRAVLPSSLP